MTQETFPMIVGGEETLNERTLLTQVESGLMMNGADSVRFIVIHCSATQSDRDYTVEQLLRDHKVRGFRTIGYHFYIRRSGIVTQHRRLLEVGAHVRGLNRCSIGICYEGGLDENRQYPYPGTEGAIEGTPVETPHALSSCAYRGAS